LARFDVYTYGQSDIDFLVDVQADMLSNLETRLVIPLVRHKKFKSEGFIKLKPTIIFLNRKFTLITPDMASVTLSKLGKLRGNIAHNHHEIIDSIDFLIQGF
jgi:toxin CcdB